MHQLPFLRVALIILTIAFSDPPEDINLSQHAADVMSLFNNIRAVLLGGTKQAHIVNIVQRITIFIVRRMTGPPCRIMIVMQLNAMNVGGNVVYYRVQGTLHSLALRHQFSQFFTHFDSLTDFYRERKCWRCFKDENNRASEAETTHLLSMS